MLEWLEASIARGADGLMRRLRELLSSLAGASSSLQLRDSAAWWSAGPEPDAGPERAGRSNRSPELPGPSAAVRRHPALHGAAGGPRLDSGWARLGLKWSPEVQSERQRPSNLYESRHDRSWQPPEPPYPRPGHCMCMSSCRRGCLSPRRPCSRNQPLSSPWFEDVHFAVDLEKEPE